MNGTKDMKLSQAVDAEFSIINPSEKEHSQIKNLPAKLTDVQLLRHQKAEPNPDYLQALKDDIGLDIELGLKTQFEIDQKTILKNDIDSLTKSNEYYQISQRLIYKLFQITQLKSRCIYQNLKEAVLQSLIGSKMLLIISMLLFVSILGTVNAFHTCLHVHHFAHTFWMTTAIFSLVWECFLLVGFIACFFNENFGQVIFDYEFLKVDLTMEDVQDTQIVIPRMAKLKMKEAKDTNIFEGFTIAYPKFSVDRKIVKPRIDLKNILSVYVQIL